MSALSRIYVARRVGVSAPTSTPSVSASAGHTLRHSKTSPLVTLKISFAACGACAAHTMTWPSRSASAISQTNDGPPGKLNASPFSRRIAAYTPMAGRTFRGAGCLPGDELRTQHGVSESVLRTRVANIVLLIEEKV